MNATTERRAQKNRTRQAILAGARKLIAEGQPVTVHAAAAAADVSRATAYRYFSDPQALALEAGIDVESADYATVTEGARTTREKVRAISLYFYDLAVAHEPAFRQFVARTLDAWAEDTGAMARRGARRVTMYETALAEGRSGLDAARTRALVAALSTATGAEAMIALHDVVQADRDEARATVGTIADALLDRFLGPAGAAPPPGT